MREEILFEEIVKDSFYIKNKFAFKVWVCEKILDV